MWFAFAFVYRPTSQNNSPRNIKGDIGDATGKIVEPSVEDKGPDVSKAVDKYPDVSKAVDPNDVKAVNRFKEHYDLIVKGVPESYAKIFAKLELSPTVTQNLTEAIIERQIAEYVSLHVLREKFTFSITMPTPESRGTVLATRYFGPVEKWADLIETAHAPYEAAMQNLLGPEKYTLFHQLENQLTSTTIINQVNKLVPKGDMLSAQQTDALVAALDRANPDPYRVDHHLYITDNVLQEVKDILSPIQFEALAKQDRIDRAIDAALVAKSQELQKANWQGNAPLTNN